MFIGYNFFSNQGLTNTNNVCGFYRMEVKSGLYDTIKADDTTDITFNPKNDTEWGLYTCLLAKYQDDFEAGNINNDGVAVEKIRLKRRTGDSLEWVTLTEFDYSKNLKELSYIDRTVRSTEFFDYCFVPVSANIEGAYNTEEIYCEFEGIWLTEKDKQYKLLYNLEYGDIENVTQSNIVETFNKYPIVNTSPLDYVQGSISSLVLSEETIKGDMGSTTYSNQINIRQERINRESLFKFLKDRKPKLLRDGAGRFYLVSIIGNPKEKPNNDLGQAICDVEFSWVQIGDALDELTLKVNGLV